MKVLFEITEANLDTGLRGVPVGYCTTSFVDEQKGLFYCNYPVSEIYNWTPEEVICLLYTGKKVDHNYLHTFKQELKEKQTISPEILHHIEALPKRGHPMDLFSAALMILGMYESSKDYEKDCINIIAKLPHLVATLINSHAGWGKTVKPDPDLGYIENFNHMLSVPQVEKNKLLEVFKLFNILHLDHGGGNLSTFCGKAVASSLEHMYGSLSASMNALAGPRHGQANQEGLNFVQEVYEHLKGNISEGEVESFIRNRLQEKGIISGFGHAVLRVEDPRAIIFYEYAQKHFSHHPLVKTAFVLRKVGSKILAENPKIKDPHPNVDAISGTVLHAAGFCYPEYFTVLFGLARCVGIAIQIVYERCYARDGKGTPIIRPRYLYKKRD